MLDYENNEVHIGVQKDAENLATIQKIDRTPGVIDIIKKDPATAILAVLVIIVVCTAVAVVVWQKKKHDGERADMVQARMLFVE